MDIEEEVPWYGWNWTPAEDKGVYLDRYLQLHYPEGAAHTDGLPEEYNQIVSPHWSKFPPQHPLIGYVASLVFFCLWCINFSGNTLVIYVFSKTTSLRTPTNMFIINLALSDLLMMSSMGLPVAFNNFFSRYWAYGVTACRIYGCLGAVFGTSSIVTMVVISWDRYNVIVKGLNGTKINHLQAFGIIIVCWIYVIASCCTPFIGWGNYTAEGLLLTCGYDYFHDDLNNASFILYTCITNYALPLALIAAFYCKIVATVITHEREMRKQAERMNVNSLRSSTEKEKSMEIRITKIALTTVLLWAFTWTPYAVVTFWGQFLNRDSISPLISQLPVFLAKTGSVMNPLVFAISHPKYKEALAVEVPWLGIGTAKVSENSSEKTETARC